jgi:TRAP-type C4-dicarboxylate transport system permease small subunit
MDHSIVRALDRLYLLSIWVAGAAIFFMSLIIPWGVFTRYVLGSGSQWPEPIAILLMMVFTFIGAAATYRAGGDIAVVMLTERLPAVPRRVLAVLVDVAMLAICLFVVGYGGRLSLQTMGQTISELPWLPVGVTYAPIPIGAAITLVFVVERMVFGNEAQRPIVRYGEQLVEARHEGAN